MAEPPGRHRQSAQAHGGPLLHHPHTAGTNEGKVQLKLLSRLSLVLHPSISPPLLPTLCLLELNYELFFSSHVSVFLQSMHSHPL